MRIHVHSKQSVFCQTTSTLNSYYDIRDLHRFPLQTNPQIALANLGGSVNIYLGNVPRRCMEVYVVEQQVYYVESHS